MRLNSFGVPLIFCWTSSTADIHLSLGLQANNFTHVLDDLWNNVNSTDVFCIAAWLKGNKINAVPPSGSGPATARRQRVRFVVNKISHRRLRIRDFYFLWGRQRLNWGHFSCVGGNEKPEGEGVAITRYAVMPLFEIDVFEDFTCLRRKITSLLIKLGGWHLYTWDFGWHVFRRF